jgi:hypothetical protein
MKNLILILGITLVSLTNVCNAANSINKQSNVFQEVALNDNDNQEISSYSKETITKPCLIEESEVFNPETVIAFDKKTIKETIDEADKIIENNTSDDLEFMLYEESMKGIIAQSDLIIENSVSNEFQPLSFERTIEDEIAELDMIIENAEMNEIHPLDFKIINKNSVLNSAFNSKTFLGMN